VTIYQADRAGNPTGKANTYTRKGSMTCTGFTPSSLPYTLGHEHLSDGARLRRADAATSSLGCSPTIPMDSIGVKIIYRYAFHTPLSNLSASCPARAKGTWNSSWSNVMRMEPIL